MSLSRITASSDAYQAHDSSANFGQVRNGFRRLLQSIHDGSLENAQIAYRNLSQTLPIAFDKVSLRLTHDYGAIGSALEVGDIAGAQRAVIQLKEDLLDIGRTGNLSRGDSSRAIPRYSAAATDSMIRSYYYGNSGEYGIGAHIDITV